jgi:hypothetical protein
MRERLARLASIMRADFLIRLRRASTVVIFLLLSATAYLWIPDPSSGLALMQIAGKRAIYDSATIAVGTATIGTIFIGLFGFYVISNALKRDVATRCGFVVASTTVRNGEYIAGKFAGNVAFLTVFMSGFMITSMVMVMVRGEASLEPFVFVKHYLLLVPPTITFVSAVAILFESTPLLRTRFGDVLYFVLWLGMLGVVASMTDRGGEGGIARYFDVSGFGMLFEQMQREFGTNAVAIGSSPFDAAKGTVRFGGLEATASWIFVRSIVTLWPLALLAPATFFFHRFDPSRLRGEALRGTRRNLVARVIDAFRPLTMTITRPFVPRFRSAAAADATMTIVSSPLAVLSITVLAIASIVATDSEILFKVILPFATAAAGLAIAGIATREVREGTLPLVFSTPRLRERFVWWKVSTAFLVAAAFLAVPLLCAIIRQPEAAGPLVVGIVFVVTAATCLGIVSGNPKTFVVVFLTFWYIVLSDGGNSPGLDFAGWFGKASAAATATYALLAMAFTAMAAAWHGRRLRREW